MIICQKSISSTRKMNKFTTGLLVGISVVAAAVMSGCMSGSNSRYAQVVDATRQNSTGTVQQSRDEGALASDHQVSNTDSSLSSNNSSASVSNSATVGTGSGYGVIHPYQETGTSSPDTYKVQPGDTLYSIAFRYNQDYHILAHNNGIEAPYAIRVGQVLNVGSKQAAPDNKSITKPSLDAANIPGSSRNYVVQTGDSVNSLSRKFNVPVNAIVTANHLQAPYYLKKGTRIVIPSQQTASVKPAAKERGLSTQTTTTSNGTTITDTVVAKKEELIRADGTRQTVSATTAAAKEGSEESVSNTQVIPGKTRTVAGIVWRWPAKGQIIKTFSNSEHGNKGIDIAGSRGQNIMAAADGTVVYAGSALRGYGNLLIVNHSGEYLSAYAHNEKLLVKEGQKVKRGQVIARMGNTDAESVRLHFEIRKKGSSVNPLGFLPKQ